MAEPFKNRVNEAGIDALVALVADALPAFNCDLARSHAVHGLADLELKARIAHVADALAIGMGSISWERQAEAVAAAAEAGAESGVIDELSAWPLARFVEIRGINDLSTSLDALERITPTASAEFAIRPFIDRYGSRVIERLLDWTRHPNVHVRRLASEGSRSRLPWGARIGWLSKNPRATEPILEVLFADPSEYVRRSVANHLGDIAKDNLHRAISIAERWAEVDQPEVAWVVRHALRGPIKAGDPRALMLIGIDADLPVTAELFAVLTPKVEVGGILKFEVRVSVDAPGILLIDYVIHHRGARGELRPKVFKLGLRKVAEPGVVRIERQHPIRPITTRRYYAGEHRVELQVNGRVVAGDTFDLVFHDEQTGR